MPLVSSSYQAPFPFFNKHLQTIYPRFFRRVKINYRRERILTPDQDFLDLDWCLNDARRLVIITHGLEGSSYSPYVMGMARALRNANWDVLAWNLRSCSGEPNWQPCWYHGGQSDDLRCVFTHALFTKRYNEIALIGFSLGANITLKFLGEHGRDLTPLISKAVVFSAPCSLASAATALSRGKNMYYTQHFIQKLKRKVKTKLHLLPESFRGLDLNLIRDFRQFDNALTGPIHGYRNSDHYWSECSANRFLGRIAIPTLIINAKDDPFLGPECYPYLAAEKNHYLYLECPSRGGHLGFISLNHGGAYWSERRALAFLEEKDFIEVDLTCSAGGM